MVTARLLGLQVGATAQVPLVRLSGALGALTVHEGWGRTAGVEEAERYEVADLGTAVRREVHLVGDVVVAADGVELASLTRP